MESEVKELDEEREEGAESLKAFKGYCPRQQSTLSTSRCGVEELYRHGRRQERIGTSVMVQGDL